MAGRVLNTDPLGPLRAGVERYYTRKIDTHGPTPLGVDWSCSRTQQLRFGQLLQVCGKPAASFSLNDFGCGYGALLPYLRNAFGGSAIDYLGIDVSQAMVGQALRLHPDASFLQAHSSPRTADYTVASGVFNVKLRTSGMRWTDYIKSTLVQLYGTSTQGLAVNFLAPRPPHMPQTSALFRPWPQPWIDFCRQELGAETTLRADYGLPEFTLLVRRPR